MALSAPTAPSHGLNFDNVKAVLRKKCRLYYALGTPDSYPETMTDVEDLLLTQANSTGQCVPLGNMNADIGKFTWTENTEKVDFMTIAGDVEAAVELTSVRLDADALAFLSSNSNKELVTLVAVPDDNPTNPSTETPYIALMFPGYTMHSEGNISLGGKIPEVTLKFERSASNLASCVAYLACTTAG